MSRKNSACEAFVRGYTPASFLFTTMCRMMHEPTMSTGFSFVESHNDMVLRHSDNNFSLLKNLSQ
jgi:hypothetical protein